MNDLPEQQEIMGALADCISEVYTFESCILRAEKLIAASGETAARIATAMTRYYGSRAMQVIELAARKVVTAAAEGDTLRTQLAILRRLAKYDAVDTIGIGRQIAQHVVAAGRYTL
jgi:butyryl-CoA dehydrogenase